eukprot:m.98859 g.98859  ORF g.98859 m.98859 type:complete len:1251 (-) comp9023_c2_seq2:133-3885(-)
MISIMSSQWMVLLVIAMLNAVGSAQILDVFGTPIPAFGSNSWNTSPVSKINSPGGRIGHAVTFISYNGYSIHSSMFLFGGTQQIMGVNTSSYQTTNDLWVFHMRSRGWAELHPLSLDGAPNVPLPRSLHSLSTAYSANKLPYLVMFGGTTDFDLTFGSFHSLRDLWLYDVSNLTWIMVDFTDEALNLEWPTPRSSHSAAMCDPTDSIIYFFGGQTIPCPRNEASCLLQSIEVVNELWKLDISSVQAPKWTRILSSSSSPSGRVFAGFVCLHNTFYLTGGILSLQNALNGSAIAIRDDGFIWTFPLDQSNWIKAPVTVQSPLNNVTDIASFHSVVSRTSDTTFAVIGGHFNPFTFREYITIFDISNNSWSAFPQSRSQLDLSSRSYSSGGSVDGTVVVFGGLSLIDLDDSVHQLLPASRVVYEVPQSIRPTGRIYSAYVFVPQDKTLYVYGGYDGRIPRADFWVFDVESQVWREIINNHQPGPRIAPLAISLNGNVYVGLGSGSNNILGDLYVLDKTSLNFNRAVITVVDRDGNDITAGTNVRVMLVSSTSCINVDGNEQNFNTHCFHFGPLAIVGIASGYLAQVQMYNDMWVITEKSRGHLEVYLASEPSGGGSKWPSVRVLAGTTAFKTASGRVGVHIFGGFGSSQIQPGQTVTVVEYEDSLELAHESWVYWLDTDSMHLITVKNRPSTRYGMATVFDGSNIYMVGGAVGLIGMDVIAVRSQTLLNEVVVFDVDMFENEALFDNSDGDVEWWVPFPSSDIVARAHHNVLIANETLTVWGGGSIDGVASANFLFYVVGCLPGHNSTIREITRCMPCPLGSYAPNSGTENCIPCPSHLTTQSTGAHSILECQVCVPDYCMSGTCVVSGFFEPSCICDIGWGGGRCQTNFLQQISIGVFICIVIIVALYIAYRRFKKRLAKVVSYNLLQEQLLEETKGELLELEQAWSIHPDEIEYLKRIDVESPGGFGQVWLAKFSDIKVAVKQLKHDIDTISVEEKEEFEAEIKFMRRLRNRNIVYFYGAGFQGKKPFLVTEYMSRGSLDVILRKKDAYPLTEERRLMFLLDTASGMSFLHNLSPPRIHRDLKSPNLLVNESWVVKVSDFGTSRLVEQLQHLSQATDKSRKKKDRKQDVFTEVDSRTMTKNVGTLLWSAPEVHQGSDYSLSADVYSFGIVMWEVYTRELPFEHLRTPWEIRTAIIDGERPAIPKHISSDIKILMERCWAQNATERPSFNDILHKINMIMDDSDSVNQSHL